MLKKYKKREVVAMIKAAFGNYLYWVQHVEEKVLILGHTHHPMLYQVKKAKGLKGITTYVNSGSWVTLNSPTWVDIHFRKSTTGNLIPQTVQLRQYDSGSVETSIVIKQMPLKRKKKKTTTSTTSKTSKTTSKASSGSTKNQTSSSTVVSAGANVEGNQTDWLNSIQSGSVSNNSLNWILFALALIYLLI